MKYWKPKKENHTLDFLPPPDGYYRKQTPVPIYDFEEKKTKIFMMPESLRIKLAKSIYSTPDYSSKDYNIQITKDKNGKYDIELIKIKKSIWRKFKNLLFNLKIKFLAKDN